MRRLLALLLLPLLLALPAAAEVSFGLAKDDNWNSAEHKSLMELHGLTDHGTVYYTLMSEANRVNPFDWVRLSYLDADIPVVMTLIIDDRSDSSTSTVGTSEGTDVSAGVPGLLEQVIRGDFDVALQELATEIARDGRPIVVRPFHEIDGGWYQWGMYASGNSCDLAAQAVNHVIDVFEGAGAENASFEINVNRRDGRQQVFGAAECFIPQVEDRIDAWSVSTYDRCGTSDNYPDARSFADDFRPIYDRLTALSRHPVRVAEVSTSGLCGDGRIAWFKEMLEDLEQFPRTDMVTFFFGVVPVGKASNSVPIYWGFDQELWLIPSFKDLIASEKETAASPSPTQPIRRAAAPAPRQPAAARSVATARPAAAPRPRPVTPASRPMPTLAQPELTFGRDWHYAGWLNVTHPFDDEPVPGYGQTGLLAQGTLRFSYLPETGKVRHGPYVLLGASASNNCDPRYWQCQARLEVGYSWVFDNRDGWPHGSDYNSWRLDVGIGHRHYWHEAGRPDRLDNGDTYGLIGLTWTTGGRVGRR